MSTVQESADESGGQSEPAPADRARAEIALLAALVRRAPGQVARHLDAAPSERAADVLASLEPVLGGCVMRSMHPAAAAACIEGRLHDLAGTLECAGELAISLVLARLAEAPRRAALGMLQARLATAVNQRLDYPPSSVGAVMAPVPFSVQESLTCGIVQERLREAGAGDLHYVYLTTGDQVLRGVTSVLRVFRARTQSPIREHCIPGVLSLSSRSSWQSALEHSGWESAHCLPVVTRMGTLVGVLDQGLLTQLQRGAAGRPMEGSWDATADALADLLGVGFAGVGRSTLRLDRVVPEGSGPR